MRCHQVGVAALQHGPVDQTLVLGGHGAAAPFAVVGGKGVGRTAIGSGRFHIHGVEGKQSAIELGGPLSVGVATEHIAEKVVVAGYAGDIGIGAVGLYPTALPILVPPLLATPHRLAGRLGHRERCSLTIVGHNAHHTVAQVTASVVPCPVVGGGITPLGGAVEGKPIGFGHHAHPPSTNGVIEAVFQRLDMLVGHGEVEDGLLRILMGGDESVRTALDMVGLGHAVFWNKPFP